MNLNKIYSLKKNLNVKLAQMIKILEISNSILCPKNVVHNKDKLIIVQKETRIKNSNKKPAKKEL